jgi:NCS1 family nucleobase:cation symporter-1
LFTAKGVYGKWGARGLIAFAIGFAAEIPFMLVRTIFAWNFTGPVATALGGIGIAWAVGLAVSAVAYLLLTRNLDKAAEETAIAASAVTLTTATFASSEDE